MEEVREFARGARIVTDTYPSVIYVGRVAAAIPNVRLIFVKRDPFDVAMRMLMKRYRVGNHYAYDVKTIFEYVSWYYEMADLWQARFPGITLTVDYEVMIAEPKATLARVAEFCGCDTADVPLPDLGDDRACSQPYREFMRMALVEHGAARRTTAVP